MAGTIKVDSINADSNLTLKIANTAVAFIDATGLRPTSGNVNLDATATSKLYLPSANTVAIQTAGVTAVTVDSSQNVTLAAALAVTGVTTVQAGTAALPALTTTGDTNTGIFFPAADTIAFSEGGAEIARFDSSGNLGIGVTPSTWTSTKAIEVGSLGTALWSSGAGSTSLSAGMYYNSGWKYANGTSKPSLIDFDNAGKITFYTVTSTGTAGNAASLTATTAIDNSGNLQFNSGYGSVATAYGCRAWVNFNGTGTVAIRASGNVTSITDNGTGNYTVNFTTAMPDVNYSFSGYCVNPSSRTLDFGEINTYATGSLRINSAYVSGTNGESTSVDATYVNISIFR